MKFRTTECCVPGTAIRWARVKRCLSEQNVFDAKQVRYASTGSLFYLTNIPSHFLPLFLRVCVCVWAVDGGLPTESLFYLTNIPSHFLPLFLRVCMYVWAVDGGLSTGSLFHLTNIPSHFLPLFLRVCVCVCGRSMVGYSNTKSELTGNDKRFLSHKVMTLYNEIKVCGECQPDGEHG